jgi:hypothetical protein
MIYIIKNWKIWSRSGKSVLLRYYYRETENLSGYLLTDWVSMRYLSNASQVEREQNQLHGK